MLIAGIFYQLKLYKRRLGAVLHPLFFLLIFSASFSILINDAVTLHKASPGILVLGIALCTLYGVDQLFNDEYRHGILIDFALSESGLLQILVGRLIGLIAFALITTMAALPAVSQLLGISITTPILATIAHLVVYFSLLGAITASLTVHSKKSNLIMVIIAWPLSFPMLVASTLYIEYTLNHQTLVVANYFMLFLNTFLITITPLVITKTLKIYISHLPNQ